MLGRVLASRFVALGGLAVAFVLCAQPPSDGGMEFGQSVVIDRVILSPDGRSVDIVVVGGAPMQEERPCGADYELAHGVIAGTTLEVQVRQTATRPGACALTDLVCCERRFTIEPVPDQPVDRVRDLAGTSDRVLFLRRPAGLFELRRLPTGWELRHEWADWGATWTRLYSPLADSALGSSTTVTFRTTFGGRYVTEPESLQSPAMVNQTKALYHRYPDVANQIQIQWLADGQALALEASERHFTVHDLVGLASSATVP